MSRPLVRMNASSALSNVLVTDVLTPAGDTTNVSTLTAQVTALS